MKQNLTTLKFLWIVWIWEPFVKMLRQMWLHFTQAGPPCCDKPDILWMEGGGLTTMYCRNCRQTRSFFRAGF